jgi:hypothetical protein
MTQEGRSLETAQKEDEKQSPVNVTMTPPVSPKAIPKTQHVVSRADSPSIEELLLSKWVCHQSIAFAFQLRGGGD